MPVVTIRMAKGRTLDQKRTLVREITSTISRTLEIPPSMVTVLIEELDKENIGIGGKLRSEE